MRYLPLTNEDRQNMLAKIGADSVDELFADVASRCHASLAPSKVFRTICRNTKSNARWFRRWRQRMSPPDHVPSFH